MNLKDFNFPAVNGVQMAFSTLRTDEKLLTEAKERGLYNGNTKYNKLFNMVFDIHNKKSVLSNFIMDYYAVDLRDNMKGGALQIDYYQKYLKYKKKYVMLKNII